MTAWPLVPTPPWCAWSNWWPLWHTDLWCRPQTHITQVRCQVSHGSLPTVWAAMPSELSQHRCLWLNAFLLFQGVRRWLLCAKARVQVSKRLQLSASSKVKAGLPEQPCTLIPHTAPRPAELKDQSNPFLSALGNAHLLFLCALFPSIPHKTTQCVFLALASSHKV